MVKSLVIWVIQVLWQSTKWCCCRCVGEDGVIFMLLLEIRLHLWYKGSQRVLMLHGSHTPQTDELSLVLWSTVSQKLGAARTMWVYFTLCQQSTLKNQNSAFVLYWRFGQTDGRRKFELGIPQSRGMSYIRDASYIRDNMVLHYSRLSLLISVSLHGSWRFTTLALGQAWNGPMKKLWKIRKTRKSLNMTKMTKKENLAYFIICSCEWFTCLCYAIKGHTDWFQYLMITMWLRQDVHVLLFISLIEALTCYSIYFDMINDVFII